MIKRAIASKGKLKMKSLVDAYRKMQKPSAEGIVETHIINLQYYRSILNESNLNELAILTEDRIGFLKKQYEKMHISTEHDPMADHKDSSSIIDHLSSVDPSKKKIYTQWLTNHYSKGAFKQEDAYRVGDDLDTFQNRRKEFNVIDIGKHTPASLKSAVENLPSTVHKSEAQKSKDAIVNGRTHVYEDDKIKIYRLENTPEGKKASQEIYGGGSKIGGTHTDWCTADKRDKYCRFDSYNESGPLHVIHEKNGPDGNEKVYQMHPASGSFMDHKDMDISNDDFGRIKDSLHKAFDEHPDLLG